MESVVSFSIRSAVTKRKRLQQGLPSASANGVSTARPTALGGVFVSAEDAAREAMEAATRDEHPERPLKKMLLEDERAKVKRLQAEGNTLAEAGRFRAAMDRWLEAIAIDPSDAVIYELLAQASMAVGDDFEAIQFGLKAVKCGPSWGEAYHTLARCHLNFGELELALHNIRRAEELLGGNNELTSDRHDIVHLLDEQRAILKRRDAEANGIVDADKLQVLSCMKHLSLRGRVGD